MAAIGYLRFTGIMLLRSSSSGACREMARLTGSPSVLSRSMKGTSPMVEIVTRRGLKLSVSGAAQRRIALTTAA